MSELSPHVRSVLLCFGSSARLVASPFDELLLVSSMRALFICASLTSVMRNWSVALGGNSPRSLCRQVHFAWLRASVNLCWFRRRASARINDIAIWLRLVWWLKYKRMHWFCKETARCNGVPMNVAWRFVKIGPGAASGAAVAM